MDNNTVLKYKGTRCYKNVSNIVYQRKFLIIVV